MAGRNSPSVLATRLLLALVFLELLAVFGYWARGAHAGLQAETLLEYGEPYIVSATWNAGTEGRLYAPVDDLPFLHNNYNPLVQTLLAPVLAATGPSYFPARLLSTCAVLGILGLLGALAWRASHSLGAALVAALLPLTAGFAHPWLYLGRVDFFAAGFSVATVFLAWRSVGRRGDVGWWWLATALVAFAAKQSVVGGAAGVLLYQALSGGLRRSLGQGLLFTAGCAGLVGLFHFLSDGQYWLHAVVYNAGHDRGSWWPQGLDGLVLGQAWGLPLIVLGVLVLPLARWGREGLALCWFLASFPLSFWLVRKSGSHVHYFFEPLCALSLVVALAGWRRLEVLPPRGLARLAALAVLALLAVALVRGPWRSWTDGRDWLGGVHGAKHASARIVGLRDRADPVSPEVRRRIAEGEGPSLLLAKLGSLAIEAGKPAIFDVADFVRLQDMERFDAAERLVPLILARRFPVIGIPEYPTDDRDQRHFSVHSLKGVMPAIEAAYRPLDPPLDDPRHFGRATFWVPKGS